MASKNIINEAGLSVVSSSFPASYEEYTLPAQTLKFSVLGEEYVSGWSAQDGAAINVVPWVKFIKIGKLVTMQIPGFYGTKSGGSSTGLTIAPPGEIPSRFRPTGWGATFHEFAWYGSSYISAYLSVYTHGGVQFVFTTPLGATNIGFIRDICVSWIQAA